MKNYLLLLVCIFGSSVAFGQHNMAGRATVIVLADSGVGQMMYLTRFRGPALDYERVDSARVGADHRARFSVEPDPLKPYQIQLSAPSFDNRIYLAAGDSLIFSYSASHGENLIFDRIGANQSFRDSVKPWNFDAEAWPKKLDSLDWDGWHEYLASRKNWLAQKAAWYASKYSEHTGFRVMYENSEILIYYNGMASYLMKHYWESKGKPIVKDPNRLKVMDSVPWTLPSFSQSLEMWSTSGFWVAFEWKQWRRAGIDTAGKEYGEEAFLLAHKLPPPARDAAVLYILDNCTTRYTTVEGVPFAEREYEAYKQIASDTAYLGAFERLRTKFRGGLAGKPAPPIVLPDTSNTMRTLSDYRGKIVYLDFWGTWCPPCREEIRSFRSLEKKFEGNINVAFVSIAVEDTEDKNQQFGSWKQFVLDSGLKGVQLYDQLGFGNEMAESYRVHSFPTYMIIDRKGNFVDAYAPRPSSGKAEDAIRAALAKAN
jgi:peroxiredoxin